MVKFATLVVGMLHGIWLMLQYPYVYVDALQRMTDVAQAASASEYQHRYRLFDEFST